VALESAKKGLSRGAKWAYPRRDGREGMPERASQIEGEGGCLRGEKECIQKGLRGPEHFQHRASRGRRGRIDKDSEKC